MNSPCHSTKVELPGRPWAPGGGPQRNRRGGLIYRRLARRRPDASLPYLGLSCSTTSRTASANLGARKRPSTRLTSRCRSGATRQRPEAFFLPVANVEQPVALARQTWTPGRGPQRHQRVAAQSAWSCGAAPGSLLARSRLVAQQPVGMLEGPSTPGRGPQRHRRGGVDRALVVEQRPETDFPEWPDRETKLKLLA